VELRLIELNLRLDARVTVVVGFIARGISYFCSINFTCVETRPRVALGYPLRVLLTVDINRYRARDLKLRQLQGSDGGWRGEGGGGWAGRCNYYNDIPPFGILRKYKYCFFVILKKYLIARVSHSRDESFSYFEFTRDLFAHVIFSLSVFWFQLSSAFLR